MKTLIFALTAALFIPLTSQAKDIDLKPDAFWIEPYVGGDNGKVASTPLNTAPNVDGKTSGTVWGARGGAKFFGMFIFGVDHTITFDKYDYTSTTQVDGDWTKSITYVFVGGDFDRVRVWGSYGLNGEMKATQKIAGLSVDTKYKGGTYIKGGVGFRLVAGLNLNGEYYSNKPKSGELLGTTFDIKDGYSKLEETGFLISISYSFGAKLKGGK